MVRLHGSGAGGHDGQRQRQDQQGQRPASWPTPTPASAAFRTEQAQELVRQDAIDQVVVGRGRQHAFAVPGPARIV